MGEPNFEKRSEGITVTIEDSEEAMDFIAEQIERGERPVVSVPEQYVGALKRGLRPHSTWIPEVQAVVGTLGRDPYESSLRGAAKRYLVRVNSVTLEQLKPRFTGPDSAFHGIVFIEGPIPPEAIEIIK